MSLEKREYYAQPRNSFWPIMADLFGVAVELPYPVRTQRLAAYHLALWDVCESAYRPGSLDASIRSGSEKPNDFTTFFQEHPRIKMICFNGAKAATMYKARVLEELPGEFRQIKSATLPSTSAANAAMPYKEKLNLWSVVRKECET
jgi:hypoxanthine-DNA glycosylase